MVAFCRYLAVVSAALLARADGFSPVSVRFYLLVNRKTGEVWFRQRQALKRITAD